MYTQLSNYDKRRAQVKQYLSQIFTSKRKFRSPLKIWFVNGKSQSEYVKLICGAIDRTLALAQFAPITVLNHAKQLPERSEPPHPVTVRLFQRENQQEREEWASAGNTQGCGIQSAAIINKFASAQNNTHYCSQPDSERSDLLFFGMDVSDCRVSFCICYFRSLVLFSDCSLCCVLMSGKRD